MSTMTLTQAHDAMIKIVSDLMAAQSPAVITLFEDVPLSAAQQAIIAGTATPVKPWVRVGVKDNLRTQATIGGVGSRRFDNQGVIMIEVYTPSGDGKKLADTLCALIRDGYEVVNVGTLWFRNARTVPIGPDGPWYHTNVVVEFQWDEVK